jgi:hypothetical protein
MLVAATALIFSSFDPSGDMLGDGRYVLPQTLTLEEQKSLDLRSLEVYNNGGKLELDVGFAGLQNPLSSPAGFSTNYLDLFIKTSVGGQTVLADTGFNTPPASGWQWHLNITPFQTRLERQIKGENKPRSQSTKGIKISSDGSRITIKTQIPAGKYGYWLTSRIFDPLSENGYAPPSSDPNPNRLYSPISNTPAVVDLMSSNKNPLEVYTTRTLEPLGEVIDRRPLFLLVLIGVSLLFTLIATVQVWIKKRT